MNFFEKISEHIKTAEMPAQLPTLPGAQPKPTRFQTWRGNLGMPAAILGQGYVDSLAKKNFVNEAKAVTGGDVPLASAYMNDMVGASLIDPSGASRIRGASDKYTGTTAAASTLIPTLAGGLRGGGPYGIFFGAGPLAQQGISNWQTDKNLEALKSLPEDQRLETWMQFNDPGQAAALKAQNPTMFDRLSSIQSNAQTANDIRSGIFDQWRGTNVGPLPLHTPAVQNTGTALALKSTGGLLERIGLGSAANSLKGLAASSPSKWFNTLMPNPAMLARGAGAGVATYGTNKLNSWFGGAGAPAVVNPETGKTQYDGDVPWWHHSLRGMRSSIAGAAGGAPLGPVGMIGGAIVNPVSEAWDDIKEIGGHYKSRLFDEDPLVKQNRMIEDSRRAWRVREANAKFDAGAAKSQAESQNFMKAFSDYRVALGIGVGVPLAGLLLYKMFSNKKKKPQPAEAEYEAPELA